MICFSRVLRCYSDRSSTKGLINFEIQKHFFTTNSVFMKENNEKELPVGVPAFVSSEMLPAINLKEIYEKNEAKIEEIYKKNEAKIEEIYKKNEAKIEEIYKKNEAKILKLTKENNKKEAVLQAKILKLSKEFKPVCNEPIDKLLHKLCVQEDFKKCLKETCKLNKVHINAVTKCIEGLYHTASKSLHGREGNEIIISAKDWVANEAIALGLFFKYYNIPFVYWDEMGESRDFPYEIAVD
ncbi:4291_t:CDS:2 [Diversispora eburnea]|uniref:4291_t:CDS:1 n=1 Tax=Diversispora eburnea TaxID=1213867 RepID=A0A9N9BCT0_9GLOM|nr:4291_t:CDS:2 [Diversispora eburnea]